MYSNLTLIILLNNNYLFADSFTYPNLILMNLKWIPTTLRGITSLGQSGPESNDNEEVLNTHQGLLMNAKTNFFPFPVIIKFNIT